MTIRDCKQSDNESVRQLFKKVFNKEHADSYWEWKYRQPPVPPIVLVWEENGIIKGHIAVWVLPAYVKGQSAEIGLRIDTMVDPDARGKGVYRQLNQEMMKRAAEADIQMLYGFPSPMAQAPLLKYTAASHKTDIARWMMMCPLLSSAGKKKHDGMVERITAFDSRFDKLAEAVKDQAEVHVMKSAAFLNWRYQSHPVHSYITLGLFKEGKLKGFIVVKKEKKTIKKIPVNIGSIVDISAVEQKDTNALLARGIGELKSCAAVQLWTLPGSKLETSLRKLRFQKKDHPLPFVTHNLTHDASLDEPENWLIAQGDVDSF